MKQLTNTGLSLMETQTYFVRVKSYTSNQTSLIMSEIFFNEMAFIDVLCFLILHN